MIGVLFIGSSGGRLGDLRSAASVKCLGDFCGVREIELAVETDAALDVVTRLLFES